MLSQWYTVQFFFPDIVSIVCFKVGNQLIYQNIFTVQLTEFWHQKKTNVHAAALYYWNRPDLKYNDLDNRFIAKQHCLIWNAMGFV